MWAYCTRFTIYLDTSLKLGSVQPVHQLHMSAKVRSGRFRSLWLHHLVVQEWKGFRRIDWVLLSWQDFLGQFTMGIPAPPTLGSCAPACGPPGECWSQHCWQWLQRLAVVWPDERGNGLVRATMWWNLYIYSIWYMLNLQESSTYIPFYIKLYIYWIPIVNL